MTNDKRRDYQDILAGLLLILIGAGAAIHAYRSFPIGTVSRMGPGMFPTWLGVTLVILGVLIALPAFFRRGTLPIPEKRPMFFVLLSGIVFALIVEWAGLVPALFALTATSVLADNKVGIVGYFILAVFLSLLAYGIFLYGLGIPIQPFIWPF
jgi:drug/metabolite transporter (DMT)-like permease